MQQLSLPHTVNSINNCYYRSAERQKKGFNPPLNSCYNFTPKLSGNYLSSFSSSTPWCFSFYCVSLTASVAAGALGDITAAGHQFTLQLLSPPNLIFPHAIIKMLISQGFLVNTSDFCKSAKEVVRRQTASVHISLSFLLLFFNNKPSVIITHLFPPHSNVATSSGCKAKQQLPSGGLSFCRVVVWIYAGNRNNIQCPQSLTFLTINPCRYHTAIAFGRGYVPPGASRQSIVDMILGMSVYVFYTSP